MKSTKGMTLLLASTFAVLVVTAVAAQAQNFAVTECPGLVTQPGTYLLKNDLVVTTPPCFDVRTSDVKIKLSGFSISQANGNGSAVKGILTLFRFNPGEPGGDRLQVLGPGRMLDTGIEIIAAADVVVSRLTVERAFVNFINVDGGRISHNDLATSSVSLSGNEGVGFIQCLDNRVSRNQMRSLGINGCSNSLVRGNAIEGGSVGGPLGSIGIALGSNTVHGAFSNQFVGNEISNTEIGIAISADTIGTTVDVIRNTITNADIGIRIVTNIVGAPTALVSKNRINGSLDPILDRVDIGTSRSTFDKNRCDPPDNDPFCPSKFGPEALATQSLEQGTPLVAPDMEPVPLLGAPLRQVQ